MTHELSHQALDELGRSEMVMAVTFDTTVPSVQESSARRWLAERAMAGRQDRPPGCGELDVAPHRLSVSWARHLHDGYAPYDDISSIFSDDLDAFQRFVRSDGHLDLPITGCELTYVNPVAPGEGWRRRGLLERLLLHLSGIDPAETLLPLPEDVQSAACYKISGQDGVALGRLYVTVHSVWLETPEPIVLVTLSARGRPPGGGADGVKVFFDTGFEWIVRGFASLTTTVVHLPN